VGVLQEFSLAPFAHPHCVAMMCGRSCREFRSVFVAALALLVAIAAVEPGAATADDCARYRGPAEPGEEAMTNATFWDPAPPNGTCAFFPTGYSVYVTDTIDPLPETVIVDGVLELQTTELNGFFEVEGPSPLFAGNGILRFLGGSTGMGRYFNFFSPIDLLDASTLRVGVRNVQAVPVVSPFFSDGLGSSVEFCWNVTASLPSDFRVRFALVLPGSLLHATLSSELFIIAENATAVVTISNVPGGADVINGGHLRSNGLSEVRSLRQTNTGLLRIPVDILTITVDDLDLSGVLEVEFPAGHTVSTGWSSEFFIARNSMHVAFAEVRVCGYNPHQLFVTVNQTSGGIHQLWLTAGPNISSWVPCTADLPVTPESCQLESLLQKYTLAKNTTTSLSSGLVTPVASVGASSTVASPSAGMVVGFVFMGIFLLVVVSLCAIVSSRKAGSTESEENER
jgi:hypothetical protein